MKVTIEITNDQFVLLNMRLESYKRELKKEIEMFESIEGCDDSWDSLQATKNELDDVEGTLKNMWDSITEKK